jgi:hypothetical protein
MLFVQVTWPPRPDKSFCSRVDNANQVDLSHGNQPITSPAKTADILIKDLDAVRVQDITKTSVPETMIPSPSVLN